MLALRVAAGPCGDIKDRAALFRMPFDGRNFDLSTTNGLFELHEAVTTQIDRNQKNPAAGEPDRAARQAARPLNTLTRAELRDWYRDPDGWNGKKQRRALIVLKELAEAGLTSPDLISRSKDVRELLEVGVAVSNTSARPAPARVEFLEAPAVFWRYYRNRIGRGTERASNITSSRGELDPSQIDPANSTFWTRPVRISDQDLAIGFGRSMVPDFERRVWNYFAPKTGFGTSPGFELHGGGQHLKVKFAETRSEPFAARIFSALGYNVEPTDHVHGLKIRYDRRLFREFNLRREIATKVSTFFVPSYTIRIQQQFDPFDFLTAAVLKNGSALSATELKRRLFYNPNLEHPEDWPTNFNPAVEENLDYLLTVPANVHSDPARKESVGLWDFSNLGHADLRELRGLGMLAAWLGWFDCRILNTRLEVLPTEHGPTLRHALTDLGSCLGNASTLTSRMCEQPDKFEWRVTQPPIVQGPGRMTISFRVVNFRPIETPEAFARMTLDDARWMARWIGRLSDKQIFDALVASGFDSSTSRLYLSKLLSRREHMERDLGLSAKPRSSPLLSPRN